MTWWFKVLLSSITLKEYAPLNWFKQQKNKEREEEGLIGCNMIMVFRLHQVQLRKNYEDKDHTIISSFQ